MRCYALAEAAVEMGKRVIVFLDEAHDLTWPCAVILDAELEKLQWPGFRVWVVDNPNCSIPWGADGSPVWRIIDHPDVDLASYHGVIYPHFGAEPIPGYPTFYGPQWMPLRKAFRQHFPWPDMPAAHRAIATYRHKRTDFNELFGTEKRWWNRLDGLICPPSTIAYEAMAARISVALHDDHDYPHIADAMIEAGVAVPAERMGWRQAEPTTAIDGRGAIRLLEALL
jgi:hypothetical protein